MKNEIVFHGADKSCASFRKAVRAMEKFGDAWRKAESRIAQRLANAGPRSRNTGRPMMIGDECIYGIITSVGVEYGVDRSSDFTIKCHSREGWKPGELEAYLASKARAAE